MQIAKSLLVGKVFSSVLIIFVSESLKTMDKITMEIESILYLSTANKKSRDDIREFYVFHYQRWNLFLEWGEDSLKFPDKDEYSCHQALEEVETEVHLSQQS